MVPIHLPMHVLSSPITLVVTTWTREFVQISFLGPISAWCQILVNFISKITQNKTPKKQKKKTKNTQLSLLCKWPQQWLSRRVQLSRHIFICTPICEQIVLYISKLCLITLPTNNPPALTSSSTFTLRDRVQALFNHENVNFGTQMSLIQS